MKKELYKGFKDAFPIFLGYFAVAFALGINASAAGLTWFQASLMSFLNLTSAGQASAIEIIKDGGSYTELVLSQIVINLRYLLMGAALSIKLSSDSSTGKRLLMSLGITDEIFAISAAQKNPLSPMYTFGAFLMALPGWTIGTAIGAGLGSILSSSVISSLSIALYAMFIAILLPGCKDIKILVLVVVSALVSFLMSRFTPQISFGIRIIIITIVLSLIFASLFPVNEEVCNE